MKIHLRPIENRPKSLKKKRKSRAKPKNGVALLSKIERRVMVNAFCLMNGVVCQQMPVIPEGKLELFNPFIRRSKNTKGNQKGLAGNILSKRY